VSLGALSYYLQSVKELFIDYRKYELKTKADTESLGIAQQAIEAAQVQRTQISWNRHNGCRRISVSEAFIIPADEFPLSNVECQMAANLVMSLPKPARLTPELCTTPQTEVQRLEAGRASALTSTQVRPPSLFDIFSLTCALRTGTYGVHTTWQTG
jgi:hypothetical protein